MNLPCLNCKADVPQGEGKFFAQVFLCEKCHTMSTHFFERLERELKSLLTVAKESIRVALVQGKFVFPEGPAGAPSKRAVLEEIIKLEEAREASLKEQSCPTSSASTPPHVLTLAALGAASSSKVSTPACESAQTSLQTPPTRSSENVPDANDTR